VPRPIPIKNSIDVSSTRARKHSHVQKLETESPEKISKSPKNLYRKNENFYEFEYCNLFLYFLVEN